MPNRPARLVDEKKLNEALRFVRDGDVLMATKPDRLARSVRDLLAIVDDLAQRKVGLVILSMGRQQDDTRSPTEAHHYDARCRC